MVSVALARAGRLWSFTIQGFEPKAPYTSDGPFRPYGVGYVDLAAEGGDAVLVEGRLTEADPLALHIGEDMDLTFFPFRRDGAGNDVVTFAFMPAVRVASPGAHVGGEPEEPR